MRSGMKDPGDDDVLQRRVIDAGIRIGFLILIVAWCIQIVRPFVLVGGFIADGFIGLFTGAVVLALGYRLFGAWFEGGRPAAEQPSAEAPDALKRSAKP